MADTTNPVAETQQTEGGAAEAVDNQDQQTGESSSDSGDSGTDEEADIPADKSEPTVRRSAKDFIIARKERQVAKARAQQTQSDNADDQGDSQEGDGKDATAIARETVQNEIKPLMDALATQADQQELTEHLSANPAHKRLAKLAQTYIEHPAYRNVPIKFIFNALALEHGLTDTAAATAATTKAQKKNMSGSSARRQTGDEPDAWEMSNEDFEKKLHEVKTRR